jgi:hypothetical protein
MRIHIWVGSRFNWLCGSGSGFGIWSRIQEGGMTHEKRKKVKKFMFFKGYCNKT